MKWSLIDDTPTNVTQDDNTQDDKNDVINYITEEIYKRNELPPICSKIFFRILSILFKQGT